MQSYTSLLLVCEFATKSLRMTWAIPVNERHVQPMFPSEVSNCGPVHLCAKSGHMALYFVYMSADDFVTGTSQ